MRSPLLALLLVTSVFALPAASAKSFAEDGQGDVQTNVFGTQALPAAAPGADAADLLSLDVVEDAEELTFTLKLANLKQQVNFARYEVGFAWGEAEYAVIVQRQVAQGVLDDNSDAYLYTTERDDEDFDGFAQLEHMIDLEAGTIMVHLPKAYVLSEKGRFPLLGDKLSDVYVEASSHSTIFQFTADSYDRMPDGDETLSYAFQFGDIQAGHLRVDADERVRVSNGGATTFVYQVAVANTGEIDEMVEIALTELPEGWNGTVQSPLRVPAGSERRVAVLMSVPFGHDHGGFSSFNVTAKSERDPESYGSIRMGVLHTPIPQPAGHHSELYLHASNFNAGIFGDVFPFTGASINTDSVHDADAPEASPWNSDGESLTWMIPLDPALRMGLDFDLDRVGEVAGAIIGHSQSTGSIAAELLLVTQEDGGWSDGILLAESDAVDLALDLNTPQPFTLALAPTPESDYVPYVRGQNMLLRLEYTSAEGSMPTFCCGVAGTPGLTTADFKMVLPLNEYHDKLTGLAETAESIEIKADGLVEKAGLPGTTMTYGFTLTNRHAEAMVIEVDLAGTDVDLATLVPAGAIELGAKESRKLTLAVSIPTDKNEGEELEVLVFAHDQADPSRSAIARTKTIVAKPGSTEAVSDESSVLLAAQQAEENDTPAPGALAVLAAIGIALVAARRRR